jgi:hypothetical protein
VIADAIAEIARRQAEAANRRAARELAQEPFRLIDKAIAACELINLRTPPRSASELARIAVQTLLAYDEEGAEPPATNQEALDRLYELRERLRSRPLWAVLADRTVRGRPRKRPPLTDSAGIAQEDLACSS